jgi:hypothetical protein
MKFLIKWYLCAHNIRNDPPHSYSGGIPKYDTIEEAEIKILEWKKLYPNLTFFIESEFCQKNYEI